jgi:putative acetyltransferase
MHIVEGGLDDPRVVALLQTHMTRALRETAQGSGHALDVSGLRAPGVTFWAAWEDDAVVGVGALRRLSADHGEIKSMHTAEAARGQGIGRAMVDHLIGVAREAGYRRVSLETGAGPAFAPARRLYASASFAPCGPFADYGPSPNSAYMTLSLDGPGPTAPSGTAGSGR